MVPGIYRLIDGSLAQKLRFETIANNLANINTTGFKKDVISFYQVLNMKNESTIYLAPGPKRHTGNELDVALEGDGFFKIQTEQGTRYTRDGSFALNADGQLITRNGDIVLGQNGPIRVDRGHVSIEGNGVVKAGGMSVDRLAIINFRNPRLLIKEGSSCYRYSGEQADIFPAEQVAVQNGYLEGSNVNPTEEMIKMVESLRVFESAQKAVQCLDEITGKMVNDAALIQ
ncbi:MAG: flagellar hook-basal body protein [Thermodesulfobacteriota bacterium]